MGPAVPDTGSPADLTSAAPRGKCRSMSHSPIKNEPEGSLLGTLAWVGVVAVLAVVALMILSWVGPLGEH